MVSPASYSVKMCLVMKSCMEKASKSNRSQMARKPGMKARNKNIGKEMAYTETSILLVSLAVNSLFKERSTPQRAFTDFRGSTLVRHVIGQRQGWGNLLTFLQQIPAVLQFTANGSTFRVHISVHHYPQLKRCSSLVCVWGGIWCTCTCICSICSKH